MPKRKRHRRNPAPGLAERSARLHRMRASLLTKLQIARRKGNMVQEQNLSRKLLKLDRLIYAPRPKFFENQAKRYRKNPGRKITYYVVCIDYPVGKAYARITKDTHGDEAFSFQIVQGKGSATQTQSLQAAKRWAKGIMQATRRPTSVDTY